MQMWWLSWRNEMFDEYSPVRGKATNSQFNQGNNGCTFNILKQFPISQVNFEIPKHKWYQHSLQFNHHISHPAVFSPLALQYNPLLKLLYFHPLGYSKFNSLESPYSHPLHYETPQFHFRTHTSKTNSISIVNAFFHSQTITQYHANIISMSQLSTNSQPSA